MDRNMPFHFSTTSEKNNKITTNKLRCSESVVFLVSVLLPGPVTDHSPPPNPRHPPATPKISSGWENKANTENVTSVRPFSSSTMSKSYVENLKKKKKEKKKKGKWLPTSLYCNTGGWDHRHYTASRSTMLTDSSAKTAGLLLEVLPFLLW